MSTGSVRDTQKYQVIFSVRHIYINWFCQRDTTMSTGSVCERQLCKVVHSANTTMSTSSVSETQLGQLNLSVKHSYENWFCH